MKCEACSDSRGSVSFVCCKCKQIVPHETYSETCKHCRFWNHLPNHNVYGRPMKGWGECQRGEMINTGSGDKWCMAGENSWCEHFETCEPKVDLPPEKQVGRVQTGQEFVLGGKTFRRIGPGDAEWSIREGFYPFTRLPNARNGGPIDSDQDVILVQEKETGAFFFAERHDQCEVTGRKA